MQKITPHLWFDKEAEQAVNFYTSIFKNSKVHRTTHYTKAGFEIHGQPEGQVLTAEFELENLSFIAINAGDIFKFNPSISFLISCNTKEEVAELYKKLSEGGSDLMPLGSYPFSEQFAWIKDKFGLTWQIMYVGNIPFKQKITPSLMYVGDQVGKAEEAVRMYTSIFKNSEIDHVLHYEASDAPDKPEYAKHIGFSLEKENFAAMDSAAAHKFTFNEAVSLLISCDTQEEIDYFWDKLSAGGDPKAQQCGWLKDRYGLSWQVHSPIISEMLASSDTEKVERFTNAFMKMKKFNLEELKKAFEGK